MNTHRVDEADRRSYHHVLQHMTPPRPRPRRIFPDYIFIDWEAYMRASDPFWESRRPATSCMYQGRVNTQGQIDTTGRMQKWLHELPEPDPKTPSPRRVQDTRARSLSAPVTHPAACPAPNGANLSPVKRFHHPNPLSQHPIQFEELPSPPPFKIPQRKSSLQFSQRASLLSQAPASTFQQGDLVQGIQQIQIGEPVAFTGATQRDSSLYNNDDSQNNDTATQFHSNDIEMTDRPQPIAVCRTASTSKRHTVQFGEMLDDLKEYLPVEDGRKHDRSESVAMADVQPPIKRRKGLLGTIRNRLSIVSTPAFDATQDGRKSSASAMFRDLGQASKGFFDRLTPANPTGLSSANPMRGWAPKLNGGKENYHIRAAFIGDSRCGKTTLLHHFTSGTFLGDQPGLNSSNTAYSMQATAPVLIDNYQTVLELWDISPRLNPNQVNPLTMSYFDIVVICFDIEDEANLKPVGDKWQHEANVFCPKTPVILLGLKSDLRRPYHTLRLRFLDDDEPTAATIGQGELTSQLIKAAAYFECSAKTGEGTADLFESMVRISVNGIKARRNISKKNRKASRFFRRK